MYLAVTHFTGACIEHSAEIMGFQHFQMILNRRRHRFQRIIIAACIAAILLTVYQSDTVEKPLSKPLPSSVRKSFVKETHSTEYGTPNFPLVVETVHRVVRENEISTTPSTRRKIMVWLNAPEWMTVGVYIDFSGCKVDNCVVTNNRSDLLSADLVLVHADRLEETEVPGTNPDQLYVFYTAETHNWWLKQTVWRPDWNTRFNWTVSYRFDSDVLSSYSRLIVKDETETVGTNYTEVVLKKSKSVVWFVSHCDTPSKRELYVEELRKYIPVDIYGKCGNLSCEGSACNNIKRQYRFYLSFENAICKDYVTEKFFNTFQYNMISVVRGGSDYAKMFPSNIFINTADFSSPRHLAEHLKALEKNIPEMTDRMRNIARYKRGGNFLKGMAFNCDLCDKLNRPIVRKYYPDMRKWWSDNVCVDPDDW